MKRFKVLVNKTTKDIIEFDGLLKYAKCLSVDNKTIMFPKECVELIMPALKEVGIIIQQQQLGLDYKISCDYNIRIEGDLIVFYEELVESSLEEVSENEINSDCCITLLDKLIDEANNLKASILNNQNKSEAEEFKNKAKFQSLKLTLRGLKSQYGR